MPRTIFVIDDNHEIVELIRHSLEHINNIRLRTFSTPQAALRKIESYGMPNLIITDLKMSSMNGIELLARLKRFDKNIPVIVFTGHPASLPPGLNCYTIFKDVHGFERLVEAVEKVLATAPVAVDKV